MQEFIPKAGDIMRYLTHGKVQYMKFYITDITEVTDIDM